MTEPLLETALASLSDAVLITDLGGRIEWVNAAFVRLTGWESSEAIGKTPRLLKSGRHTEAFYRQMWETILAGETWRGELYNRRKDGSVYLEEQVISPIRDASGAVRHFAAIKRDASSRQRLEDQFTRIALHDPLTGLPGRRALHEALARAVEEARRGEAGALLVLDLDNFKLVNDSVGLSAGDQVLFGLAGILGEAGATNELVARIEGDAFAVLLGRTSLDSAREAAERLRRRVEVSRLTADGHTFDLTVSVGVAQVGGTLAADAVLAAAEAALASAKQQGKNRVSVAAAGAERPALVAEGRWAARLKSALRDQRLVLFYQPVVSLKDGTAGHFETLLRLRDEDGHFVAPGTFLPAAEHYGLMPQIDRWVVEKVLETLTWEPGLTLFVNLSGVSMGDERLLHDIEGLIRQTGLDASRLGFEITETAVVADLFTANRWIRRMKEIGCLFALDDFGVGFSSFAYLRSLPVDFVKIDGSFVKGLEEDATNRALVRAISTVSHVLGKEVVAEWVETERVAAILRDLGVELGQGYFWGRPGPEIVRAPLRRAGPSAASVGP